MILEALRTVAWLRTRLECFGLHILSVAMEMEATTTTSLLCVCWIQAVSFAAVAHITLLGECTFHMHLF